MYIAYQHKKQNPIQIHYKCSQGEHAMILLHGWGQNMQMMDFIYQHFQSSYKVFLLDLPGFGKSEEPQEGWGIEDYTLCIHNLCKQLHIKNPIIIAHSFGARIAISYAYQYVVKQLILTGAAGIIPKRTWKYYGKVCLYKLCKHLPWKVNMGSSDYKNASAIMQQVLVKAVNLDVRLFLSYIDVPTLLVWGEYDEQTPLWMGKIMQEELQDATLIVFEKDNHFAYFNQSNRFLAVLEHIL